MYHLSKLTTYSILKYKCRYSKCIYNISSVAGLQCCPDISAALTKPNSKAVPPQRATCKGVNVFILNPNSTWGKLSCQWSINSLRRVIQTSVHQTSVEGTWWKLLGDLAALTAKTSSCTCTQHEHGWSAKLLQWGFDDHPLLYEQPEFGSQHK